MYAVVLQVAITCTCRYSLWLSFRLDLLLAGRGPSINRLSLELLAADATATNDADDVISIVVFAVECCWAG